MPREDRNASIDAYFDALDANDPRIAQSELADGFVYESPSGTLEGFAGLETYIEELRGQSNSNHEVTQVIHGETASIAEGTVTVNGEDGPVETDFCDVFEFDADEYVARIGVYLNDS